jgi:hypothetical protein
MWSALATLQKRLKAVSSPFFLSARTAVGIPLVVALDLLKWANASGGVGLLRAGGERPYGCCAVDKLMSWNRGFDVRWHEFIKLMVQARTAAQEEELSGRPMSARMMSALQLKADSSRTSRHLRLVPISDMPRMVSRALSSEKRQRVGREDRRRGCRQRIRTSRCCSHGPTPLTGGRHDVRGAFAVASLDGYLFGGHKVSFLRFVAELHQSESAERNLNDPADRDRGAERLQTCPDHSA